MLTETAIFRLFFACGVFLVFADDRRNGLKFVSGFQFNQLHALRIAAGYFPGPPDGYPLLSRAERRMASASTISSNVIKSMPDTMLRALG